MSSGLSGGPGGCQAGASPAGTTTLNAATLRVAYIRLPARQKTLAGSQCRPSPVTRTRPARSYRKV